MPRRSTLGKVSRIERGLLLALNDAVTTLPDGTARVRSGTDREVYYLIHHGWCDCPDRYNAPGAWCKHVYALHLHLIASTALKAHDAPLPLTRSYPNRHSPPPPPAWHHAGVPLPLRIILTPC